MSLKQPQLLSRQRHHDVLLAGRNCHAQVLKRNKFSSFKGAFPTNSIRKVPVKRDAEHGAVLPSGRRRGGVSLCVKEQCGSCLELKFCRRGNGVPDAYEDHTNCATMTRWLQNRHSAVAASRARLRGVEHVAGFENIGALPGTLRVALDKIYCR